MDATTSDISISRVNHSRLQRNSRWFLFATLILGVVVPIAGTVILGAILPEWSWVSMPVHSTVEVVGSTVGLVLAFVVLFSQKKRCASRRLSIVCALTSMAIFDFAHSCVPASEAFVWLHSIANLAGGVFFVSVWMPERSLTRFKAVSFAMIVLAATLLVSGLSMRYPEWIPVMLQDSGFSPVASVINFSAGVLTVLGGLAFAVVYHRKKELEDLVFLFLCMLFGMSGLLFRSSNIWEAGWWFWHGIRVVGYILPFGLAMVAYRLADDETIRTQTQLALAVAKGDYSLDIPQRHEHDELGGALRVMTTALRENKKQLQKQDWLKSGLSRLHDTLRGDPDAETLASNVITEISTTLEAQIGAFYIAEEDGVLSLFGSYAFSSRKNLSNAFKPGEGLVGQAAREKTQILLRNVPEDYIKITTQMGECTPRFVCVTPFLHDGRVKGVIEIGILQELSVQQLDYLSSACDALGLALESAQSRSLLGRALENSQVLTEELQLQKEGLRTANDGLEAQSRSLKQSEEELKIKAAELERTSKYKSEFLANMSHELRTPLNSLLILSDLLVENGDGNLTAEQIDSAKVIYGCGKDLLSLINEILDLAKIEAGKVNLDVKPISVKAIAEEIQRGFQHVFDKKGIRLDIQINADAPTKITSDQKRIEQILKNFISNSVKFTENGGVTVTFSNGEPGLCIAVKDTGVGIPAEKQNLIFEAFQQADGGTARKYGGTGLGLSISKELAHILGGSIHLQSEEGQGAVFSVHLPLSVANETSEPNKPVPQASKKTTPNLPAPPAFGVVPDDRDCLDGKNFDILIVEDDPVFAKTLLKHCHDKGLKGLVASSGEEGLVLVGKYLPSAVILDINLPCMDGWSVLSQIKENIKTRHIPVHIMSADDPSQSVHHNGAIGFLKKPLEKEDLQTAFEQIEDVLQRTMKDLLVVEDDDAMRSAILKLVGGGDVRGTGVTTGKDALEKLTSEKYDCFILDLNLADMSGFELLDLAKNNPAITLPPVIVYTGRELTREDEETLKGYSESIIVKGVRSQERLFDDVSLFLHRIVEKMPPKKCQMIANLHNTDLMFKDKTVLIVDDDMRNLFALSNALSAKGIQPIKVQNGEKALEALDKNPDIELVLMDIMMPVLDGYETMIRIRKQRRFEKLPIIALTAKAMKTDRQKCIDAGANDYLSKPIDMERLLSMMRVWMYR